MKIHNIFHLNFLQKVLINTLIHQLNKPIILVIINNKDK